MNSEKKWYSTSFRRNLVDMHIDGWNAEFLQKFDERQYFECLKKAHIKSPMIYTHSHVGYCNWDSESGEVHPAFKGNNKIRKLFDLCHNEGMDVVAYYSLIYNNWAHGRHPEWRMLNAAGEHSRADGSRYGLICPNNAGYRAFLGQQFSELCSVYRFEGIFLDMTFWPMVCCCDCCRERFRKEAGQEIPDGVDWSNPVWLSFEQARERWLNEFAATCTAELKRLKPDVTVEHQFSTITQSWPFGVNEGINDASDYSGGDLYGGYLQQSFISKLYYEITINQPFEYMTSRCDPGLADHTTTKDPDSLRQHNYLTLAHHGAFLAIDAIDPKGTLNSRFYELLGGIFEESMPYEQYMTGKLRADVAILMSFQSKMNVHVKGTQTEANGWSQPQLQHPANVGAAAALTNRHHCWTALPCSRLDKLEGKKVAILSEAAFLTEEQIDRLCAFVEAGGALYASGSTSPALMERLLGMEFKGYTDEEITYVAPTDAGRRLFGGQYSADYPLAFQGPQTVMDVPDEHTVLATVMLPYTNPKDPARFAAIHSNPPGIHTKIPALVLGNCGNGRVMWSAAGFERNGQRAHRDVFANVIDELYAGRKPVETDAPGFIEFLLFDDADNNRLLLSSVNVQEIAPIVQPGDIVVKIRAEKPVKRIALLPASAEIPFAVEGDYVSFVLKGLRIFQMYSICFQA